MQLADAPLIDMDLLYWSRHFRNMPGQGDLPVRDFMQAVAATGYDGYLSLEIFNDQFRGGSAKSISVDGRRSLVWLMDQVRREEPALQLSVPPMPDRIGVEGVEFIEFAANRHGANELGALLKVLGFREAGRHVSKDVALYRQGEINIVINTEREGFAHSSFWCTEHRPTRSVSRLRMRRRPCSAPARSTPRYSTSRSGRANSRFRPFAASAAG